MEAIEFFIPGKTKDVTRRFLGVFARQLRKRLLAFAMSVCLSVYPFVNNIIAWLRLDNICEILCSVSDGQIYTWLKRDRKHTLYTENLLYA